MKILALDIATSMGIAAGNAGGIPRAWSLHLGKPPNEKRFSRLLIATSRLLDEHKPDLVAIEAPVGGKMTSHYLVGLAACAAGCAANRNIPVVSLHIDTVRKHFCGRAWKARDFPTLSPAAGKKAVKAKVMAQCGLLKWDFDGDDSADALACWSYASTFYGRAQAAPLGGLFNG